MLDLLFEFAVGAEQHNEQLPLHPRKVLRRPSEASDALLLDWHLGLLTALLPDLKLRPRLLLKRTIIQ